MRILFSLLWADQQRSSTIPNGHKGKKLLEDHFITSAKANGTNMYNQVF